jgi:hypothetical protein
MVAGAALAVAFMLLPDPIREAFKDWDLRTVKGVAHGEYEVDMSIRNRLNPGRTRDPTQAFIEQQLKSTIEPSRDALQLMERHGYRYEGIVGGRPTWSLNPPEVQHYVKFVTQ